MIGPARRVRCEGERTRDLQDRGNRRGVVGRAVADVVTRVHVATAVTDVVVVGADHHVLVGKVRTRDHADQVGAEVERLLVRVDTGRLRVRAVHPPSHVVEQVVLRAL